ncbi:MAG: SDR family oxidoreductase [Lewinellaceae bacterium]|nr:SDR family oxidoreductase [Saprospiraceae bacterium]MCB9339411.1 SDR family oxidoreductase [Lewinellaceae bacterium]
MKYLLTGATGFIGVELAKQLAQDGHTVHALFRNETKTARLKSFENVRLFKGDILDTDSLSGALKGCDGVFHTAAFAKPWDKDSQTFYKHNVQGSLNVFEAARKAGVKRIVFTSTAGVISPSNGVASNENTPRKLDYFTHYERSKAQAEEEVAKLVKDGLAIITVNPTRVYGPGQLAQSNGVTKMIKLYLQGKFKILPGNGKSVGNYAFIDDVVQGHIKAMQKGKPGERYILGGENISFADFFDLLSDLTGKSSKLYKMPIPVMRVAAKAMEIRANLTGSPPLLTPPWVERYMYNWELSSEKAIRQLDYHITPIEEGLSTTIDWIFKNRR